MGKVSCVRREVNNMIRPGRLGRPEDTGVVEQKGLKTEFSSDAIKNGNEKFGKKNGVHDSSLKQSVDRNAKT